MVLRFVTEEFPTPGFESLFNTVPAFAYLPGEGAIHFVKCFKY